MSRKKKAAGKRMAKMVSLQTNAEIQKLAELIRKYRDSESPVSDNDAIAYAVKMAIAAFDD